MNTEIKDLLKKSAEASELLKLLSNSVRLLILCLLIEKEMNVTELQKILKISQSALSQHLSKLRAQKIIKARRKAQNIYYFVADIKAKEILKCLHKIYC